MDYCGPRGIPLSAFLSWDVDDQAAALAWQDRDRESCQRCGTPAVDWDETRGGDRNAYRAVKYRCRGCEELEVNAVDADDGKGAHVRLVPNWALKLFGGRLNSSTE